MLVQQWLTSLQNQLRSRFARSPRGRRQQDRRLKTPSAQALVSRNVIETLEDRTLLTAFTVVNTDDSGEGSLRAAIEAANANAGADTISFDAALSGETIVLNDELLISDDLTITGLGADQLTLDGDNNSRIFRVDDGVFNTDINVEISGLTLANGSAENGGAIYNLETLSIVDSTLSGNTALQYGGGIYSSQADQVSVSNSIFDSNAAFSGGAIYNSGGSLIIDESRYSGNQATGEYGGAIYFSGVSAHIDQSQFTKNYSEANGGALYAFNGNLTVTASQFTENEAKSLGGGIQLIIADAIVNESTFFGNEAGSGGAINILGRASLAVSSSTFTLNTATSGGAISNNGAETISIENSTLSYNLASHQGGALFTFVNTAVSVVNSTIIGNEATHFSGGGIYRHDTSGSFLLRNSIVAGNTSSQFSGSYTGSNNIIQSSIDGLLDPVLRDNGGLTQTHALITGSAAIDAGSNSAVVAAGLTQDQRGGIHHRILNGIVDIGAYESYSGLLQVDSISDLDDGNYATGQLTLREAVNIANNTPEVDLITFNSSLTTRTIVLNSEILISSSMTIAGLGAELLTISGNNNSRIFKIDDSIIETEVIVALSGFSLTNGFSNNGGAILNFENLTVSDAIFAGNDARAVMSGDIAFHNGGGIYNEHGTLTVLNTTFQDNFAYGGGGIYNNGGLLTVAHSEFIRNTAIRTSAGGGGIQSVDGDLIVSHSVFVENSGAYGAGIYFKVNSTQDESQPVWTMNISNSTFADNSGVMGGGIHFDTPYKTLTQLAFVTDSTFTQNVTSDDGAGIFFNSGQAVVERCTFTGNISDRTGGGIGNHWATLTVKDSSFSHNSARVYGGGIANGGFFAEEEGGGDIFIINSTISENSSSNNAGGFFNLSGFASILNSTISGNSAKSGGAIYTRPEGPGAVSITSSTITGNTANYTGGISSSFVDVVITNSIVAGNSTNISTLQNLGLLYFYNSIVQDSIDGLLDPVLRDNGGPTKTHALIAGSSAINAGDNSRVIEAGLEFDQRGIGFDRIVGTAVDIGAYEVDVFHAQIDMRIVGAETPTSANGEAEDLPASLLFIDEWGSYWLEVWISTPSTTDRGILSAALQLSYNTSITSATSIEYGKAFSINQTGTINDQTGTVENLSAETSQTDAGDDQYVLFARIRFESTEQDGIELDLEGKSLRPQRPDFEIDQPEIIFSEGSDSSEVYGTEPYTQIWANPYDLNDDDVINYRDLIQLVNVYGAIPSESSSDYAWFADYDRNDRVNYRDLIQFVGNYGRSKANANAVSYPANFPFAWNQLLTVESQQPLQTTAKSVTQAAAETMLESAKAELSPQLDSEQQQLLSAVDVQVVDLAAGTLGRAVPGTIYIDVNAAGYGWFVDATPADNSEFSSASELSLIALPDSEAAGHVDLWTVILHELGHLLGYDHTEDGVMQESLTPGERRLVDWDDSDEFFADLTADQEFTAF